MRIADGKLVKLQHANERKTLSLHVGGVNLKITRFFAKKKKKKKKNIKFVKSAISDSRTIILDTYKSYKGIIILYCVNKTICPTMKLRNCCLSLRLKIEPKYLFLSSDEFNQSNSMHLIF